MPNFKGYNYRQSSMVVINFEDQIQPGTFEYALHVLITHKLDLSVFDIAYGNDTGGRAAYDPAILLKIILFAYSRGITSSREIAWCCEHNILFKALSCDTTPHFTTIARFVSSHTQAVEAVFEQVLLVCHEEGLLGNTLFAIDGCKMPSNAAKEWSGTFDELEHKRQKLHRQVQRCIKEHQQLDRRRSGHKERSQRLEQSIRTLEGAHHKIAEFLQTQKRRVGQGKRPKEVKSNITDNESAKMATSKGTIQGYNGVAAVDRKHQIIIEAQAFGEGQEHHTLKPILEGIQTRFQRIGVHDNIYQTGVVITADTGFANEANNVHLKQNRINAYIPDNQFRSRDPRFKEQKVRYGKRGRPSQRQVVKTFPPSAFHLNARSKTCTCPEGKALWLRSEGIDAAGNQKLYFEGRLTDCRNCPLKYQCLQNPGSPDTRKGHGRQVSFIVARGRKPTATDWMRRRVDSALGRQIYSHRMSVV